MAKSAILIQGAEPQVGEGDPPCLPSMIVLEVILSKFERVFFHTVRLSYQSVYSLGIFGKLMKQKNELMPGARYCVEKGGKAHSKFVFEKA
jgi:hypothetical protein